jgi:hypothetical protein
MGNDYTFPMPQKMGDRGSAGGAGYQKAQIARGGNRAQGNIPMLKSVDQVTLQPPPVNPPTFPEAESGFEPDRVSADSGNDAQDVACDAPEVEQTTEKPSPVPMSASAPDGGGESDPTPGDADPGPVGGSEKPGYASLLDEPLNHPVGYGGKGAR